MAQVVGNQVKLNNGQLITPQTGGWYDGQQYWGGTLSQPGQINPLSNQPGAGQPVSKEVIAQTAPENVAYIEAQRAKAGLTQSLPATGVPVSQPVTPSATGTTGTQGTTTGIPAFTAPVSIDLPTIYTNLYKESGISAIEEELSQKTKEYTEAKGRINDNPFLSEATRVGRVAKLEQLFNERTANLRGDIATKKADVEMKLNLQMKQFDLQSQATQLAWQQFNTLLTAGALNNASGEDIANITKSTGISSDMIRAAIEANKKKGVETSVIQSTNNAGVVTISVVNSNTGEIIKQTSLGAVGKVQTGGGGTTTPTKNMRAQFLEEAKTIQGKSIGGQWWGQFALLVASYAPFFSLEEIYSLYMQSALGKKYGKPTENAKQIKELYDYYRSGKEPKESGELE